MSEDNSLLAFKSVSNFVADLCSVYGKKHKPLKLYNRLISKTMIAHDQAIKKHLGKFREFCIENREAISAQDYTLINKGKISYSDTVYIDLKYIFSLADKDKDTLPEIWQHVLTISALLDPAGKAREILKKNMESGQATVSETNFLTDIIAKVEKSVDPNANPMEAISTIMQSGILTDIISGMQGGISNGQLDIGKLLGAVQGMVSTMGEQATDPDSKQAMTMVTSLMGSLPTGGLPTGLPTGVSGTPSEPSQPPVGLPDMSVMLQSVFGMMSAGATSGASPSQFSTEKK